MPPRDTRDEDLTSQVDGVTDTFTISTPYVPLTLRTFVNGNKQRRGTIVGGAGFEELTITTFRLAAPVLKVGDELQVHYEVSVAGDAVPIVVVSGIDPASC